MKRIVMFICFGFCSFFLTAIVLADTLLLENGGSFEGIVIERTDEAVIFEVGIGTITVDNNDIAEIIEVSDDKNQNIQEEWQKQADLKMEQALQEEKQEEPKSEVIVKEKELIAPTVNEETIQNIHSPINNKRVVVNVLNKKAGRNAYLLGAPTKKTSKKLSLVIGLHWYDGNSMGFMNYWRNEVSKGDIIVACPKSIGQGWTEDDVSGVLKMIEDIKESYDIDKIYLVGHSSGGNFALYLGLKYPEKFKAIASVAGSIARARQGIGKVVLSRESRKHIPVLVYIGDKDTKQRIFNAQNTKKQLKDLGYKVEYKQIKEVPHVYMPWYTKDIREWFESQK
ncbi:MAG: alpha/beta fold hydrolase [Candidatus Omnitrophica bacterium]|nr:alpha/beta fold hydrolase [Candidatus Omnitrophota bacterium]